MKWKFKAGTQQEQNNLPSKGQKTNKQKRNQESKRKNQAITLQDTKQKRTKYASAEASVVYRVIIICIYLPGFVWGVACKARAHKVTVWIWGVPKFET